MNIFGIALSPPDIPVTIFGSNNNIIRNNFIGVDVTGTVAIPNMACCGFDVEDSANNLIQNNLISGNRGDGLIVEGINGTGNQVIGNLIGTDVTGTVALGNGGAGLALLDQTSGNTFGGVTAADRNLISGNHRFGIAMGASSNGLGLPFSNTIRGNFIGTNAAGTAAIPNDCTGINVEGPNEIIGGTAMGAGNLISGNRNTGANPNCPVSSVVAGIQLGTSATGTVIQGNFIGVDITGAQRLPNSGEGVNIFGTNNTVGGTAPGAPNVISGNDRSGVFLNGPSNSIVGNFLGLNAAGTAAARNAATGTAIFSANNIVQG
ncbi:MAG TPA: hypothetical protein VNM37_26010, partial [Candidatus Dormibacteraeota bacterium]|nr:hypothetical protein [Candidatus Dormibacteraeota bacterium]